LGRQGHETHLNTQHTRAARVPAIAPSIRKAGMYAAAPAVCARCCRSEVVPQVLVVPGMDACDCSTTPVDWRSISQLLQSPSRAFGSNLGQQPHPPRTVGVVGHLHLAPPDRCRFLRMLGDRTMVLAEGGGEVEGSWSETGEIRSPPVVPATSPSLKAPRAAAAAVANAAADGGRPPSIACVSQETLIGSALRCTERSRGLAARRVRSGT